MDIFYETLEVSCPRCSSENSITLDPRIGNFRIDCSECGRTVGFLDDILRAARGATSEPQNGLPVASMVREQK